MQNPIIFYYGKNVIKNYIYIEKKIKKIISPTNKILAYSAIKIRANRPALYSMLKPETSSDSPSVK